MKKRLAPRKKFRNALLCGDVLEELPRLPDECARLVIADPPYFNVLTGHDWDTAWQSEDDYLRWTLQWMDAAMRVLAPDGLLYCFGQIGKKQQVMLHLMASAAREYSFHDLIVWDRVVGYNNRRDSFTPAYELILVLKKNAPNYFNKDAVREPYDEKTIADYARDQRYKNRAARMEHLQKGKYATNIWRISSLRKPSLEKVGHPSQKPEKLIENIVLSSSETGDLVLDLFAGSGTTSAVAKRLGRDYCGIEANADYVERARERVRGNEF